MTIKIEVKSVEIAVKNGTSARTGKPYSIREQEAWAYTTDRKGNPHPYPQRIRLNLEDDAPAYSVGFYTLSPGSFYVDRFNGLALGPVLTPIASKLAQQAA
ncbi:MAG: G5P family DNA-binding protein [Rhodocyclaceae bacterium]|jgi:hypothetical protein|nr:G5P family DNA-binding protein [Rhodocyclaceae bacterium]